MANLATLPPELVGLILGFDDSSAAVIPLWTCGSSLLNRQIAKGVTRFVYRSGKESHFPSLLFHLTALRSLSITVSLSHRSPLFNDVFYPKAFEILQTLRATLEELDLQFLRAIELIFPRHSPLRCFPHIMTPPEVVHPYPRLQRLSAAGSNEALPPIEHLLLPSLTSLKTHLSERYKLNLPFVESLPPSLLSLSTSSSAVLSTEIATALPPTLTSLSWKVSVSVSIETLLALPASITTLKLMSGGSAEEFAALPSNLRSLNSRIYTTVPLEESVKSLPNSLTWLKIRGYWSQGNNPLSLVTLQNLPRTITTLECLLRLSLLREGFLPQTLTSLTAVHTSEPKSMLPSALPASLKHLALRVYPNTAKPIPAKSQRYPSNLTSLSIEIGPTDFSIALFQFPLNVRRMVVNKRLFDVSTCDEDPKSRLNRLSAHIRPAASTDN